MTPVPPLRPDLQRQLTQLLGRWAQLCATARNGSNPGPHLLAIGDGLYSMELLLKEYVDALLEPPEDYQAPCTCDDTVPFAPPCAACREGA